MNRKRKLTLLLFASMLLTLLLGITASAKTSTVATIGSKKYTSLESAIKKVKNGGTIVLKKNVTCTKPLTISRSGKKFTIDLNKHTITLKSGAYLYIKKGTATIKNGTVKQTAQTGTAVKVARGAALNVSGGTYYGLVSNAGTMTVTKGTFTSVNKKSNLKTCLVTNTGTMTIKGGTFKGLYNRTLDNSGVMKITGGTFQDTMDYGGKTASGFEPECPYLVTGRKGTLTISGGSFKTSAIGFYNAPKAKLTIKKGTFNCTNNGGIFCNRGALTVSGGTFKIVGGDGIFYDLDGITKVTGGTFKSEWTIAETYGDSSSITISGGSFSSSMDNDDLALLLLFRGKISVKGGTFTGKKTGACFKAPGTVYRNTGGKFKTRNGEMEMPADMF